MTNVRIVVDGTSLAGWKSVQLNKSLDALCGTFSFSIKNTDLNVYIGPGQLCQIYVNDILFMTGYIERRQRSGDSNGTSFTISGREKTLDLVDCTCGYKSGAWDTDSSIDSIIALLANPYGIKCVFNGSGERTVKGFALQDGETVYAAIDRICRLVSAVPITNADGDIEIITIGTSSAHDSLLFGHNLLSFSEDVDFSDRYSDYEIVAEVSAKGTYWSNASDVDSESNVTIVGVAKDALLETLGRYRNLRSHTNYQASRYTLARDAKFQAQIRAGRSFTHSCSIHGWLQANKKLWEVNTLVRYTNSDLKVDGDYLISAINYSYSENGETLDFTLKDSLAYSTEPVQVKKPKKAAGKTDINYWRN